MMARTVSVGRVAICRALIFHFIFSSLLVLLDRPATAKSNVRKQSCPSSCQIRVLRFVRHGIRPKCGGVDEVLKLTVLRMAVCIEVRWIGLRQAHQR